MRHPRHALGQVLTRMPMLRAVPATTLIAISTEEAFRFGILVSAIYLSCPSEIEPTPSRPGAPDSFSTPAAVVHRSWCRFAHLTIAAAIASG